MLSEHPLAVHQVELQMQNEELRQAQKELLDSKNDYFELYEFAPVGYMNLNERGLIMSVNLSMVKLFNVPRNKLLGRYFTEFIDNDYHDAFFRHLNRVPSESKSITCELALHTPDGRKMHVRLESVYAGMTLRGKRTIRAALVDMTELDEARRRLQTLNAELEHRVGIKTALAEQRLEQLKQLNLDLIRAEQRERQRLSEILHDDLQQILVGCQYYLSFLRGTASESEKADFLNRIEEAIRQTIHISRSLSHELCPPVLQHSGLAVTLNWFSGQIKEIHGLDVRMCMSNQTQRYPTAIEIFVFQCARELLLNTVKHAKVDIARVTLDYQQDHIILQVVDEGAGFDGWQLNDKEEEQTGFGLLNLKRRIETMGGTFTLETAVGRGCTATVCLPCMREIEREKPELPDEQPETQTAEPKPHKKRRKGPLKVMLVDDHQILRRGLTRLLETQKGITVVAEAEDGKKAVEKARACRPDVVLMDINMPTMDGIEATARIVEENPNIRVIALTLHEDEWMVEKMLKAGAALFLTKNAPAEELIEAILSDKPALI